MKRSGRSSGGRGCDHGVYGVDEFFAQNPRFVREQALFRLGLSEDTASILDTLSPAQMMKLAAGSTLLCQFRMNDDLVWGLLTNHGRNATAAANYSVSRLHASILLAGRHAEAA